jgi:two-component system chemotaxis sensor kinase CheA
VELILDSKEFKENFSTLNINGQENLFRTVHTLKARFGFFSIAVISSPLNEMETSIENKDAQNLEKSFKEFSHALETFIKNHRSLIEASNKFLVEEDKAIPTDDLLHQIDTCSGLPELKNYILNNFILTDLKNKFSKYADFVKQIGEKQGKLVELEIDGPEILINQNKYQNFVNTSIHLFRNMVDHGLEEEHIRIEKTKPKVGKIISRFSLNKDKIIIVIEDDGRGLDLNKIKEECIKKGIKKKEELVQLKEDEINRFIFEPGFSTKEKITDLSGRGIGLDSVKKEIDLLGGTIEVESAQDIGTRFIINLPIFKDT